MAMSGSYRKRDAEPQNSSSEPENYYTCPHCGVVKWSTSSIYRHIIKCSARSAGAGPHGQEEAQEDMLHDTDGLDSHMSPSADDLSSDEPPFSAGADAALAAGTDAAGTDAAGATVEDAIAEVL